MSTPSSLTYGQLKRVVGARLHLRPPSLNIFGIFQGTLSSPTSLCDDGDSVPEDVSKLCLRRLTFDCDKERVYLEEDLVAMTLVFWEVLHEHEAKRILPPWSKVEEKVLKKELSKGWVVSDYGGVVWPAVENMREFLRFVRMKRSSYFSSCFFKVDSCMVKFTEPVFAGVLPRVGNREMELLNVAVTLSGIVFLNESGQKLCEVPWCAVSRLKMDTESNFFTIDVPAMDNYGIVHSVNIPVETSGVEYLYSISRHVIKMHEKVMAILDLRCPRSLTINELALLNWIKPREVCMDHFSSWVLPHSFKHYMRPDGANRKHGCVRFDRESSSQAFTTKQKALHSTKKTSKKTSSCRSSNNLRAADEAVSILKTPASSLVSSLDNPCKRNFAIAYFSHLNSLNSLLKDYNLRGSARSMVRNASRVLDSATSNTKSASDNPTSSQITSCMSLVSGQSVIKWKVLVAGGTDDPRPVQVESVKNNCYTGAVLFRIDYFEAVDLAEKSMKKFSVNTTCIPVAEGECHADPEEEVEAEVAERDSKKRREERSDEPPGDDDITDDGGGVPDKDSSTGAASGTEDASSNAAAKNISTEKGGEVHGEKGREALPDSVVTGGPMVEDSAETGLSDIVPSATGTGGRSSGTTTSYVTVYSSKTASCSEKEGSDQLPSVCKVPSEDEAEADSQDDEVGPARKKSFSSTRDEFISLPEDELACKGNSNASLAVDLTPLPRAKRIVTVRAFRRRSFNIPFVGGDSLVGRVKEFIAIKCLHLKKSSFGIFGIFLPTLGSPGAFLLDKSTFPSSLRSVCFQRVSFSKSLEHSVIRSDRHAVELLYSEARYAFRQGMILPALPEAESAYLEALIEHKSKLAFVRRVSGFNIGTKHYPKVSPAAEYWWSYFYRAEFCCVYGRFLGIEKGEVIHLALSLDQLVLMDMNDDEIMSWPMDYVQGVFLQHSDIHHLIVLELLVYEDDNFDYIPDNTLLYLTLETVSNEYIFSLLEHVFHLRMAECCHDDGRNVTEEDKCDMLDQKSVNPRSIFSMPKQLTKDDPVFRIVNVTACSPLKANYREMLYCEQIELHDVLAALCSKDFDT